MRCVSLGIWQRASGMISYSVEGTLQLPESLLPSSHLTLVSEFEERALFSVQHNIYFFSFGGTGFIS
jgi:hypothetical protein